jgi:hypothetical protein
MAGRLPLVLAGLAAVAVAVVWSVTAHADTRVVAVGDVHGSIDGLTSILTETGLIDEQNRWAGGNAVLVQTGDLLDRGVAVREVMDLLMRLQQEAPATGGRVIVLLGNHETMNLAAIVRDVNRDVYAAFADEDSDRRRNDGFKAFRRFWQRRARRLGEEVTFSDDAKEQWMALYPLGMLEYAESLGPDGEYGRWLRGLQAATIVDRTLFLHGGFGPQLDGMTIDDINHQVVRELATLDELRAEMVDDGLILPWHSLPEIAAHAELEIQAVEAEETNGRPADPKRVLRSRRLRTLLAWQEWFLVNPDGPIWFRGLARWDEAEHTEEIAQRLAALDVDRMVVGHTPQSTGRITPRFDNRVFLIDTGMLESVYAGRPSALEIADGTVTAIYLDDRHELVAPDAPPAAIDERSAETR